MTHATSTLLALSTFKAGYQRTVIFLKDTYCTKLAWGESKLNITCYCECLLHAGGLGSKTSAVDCCGINQRSMLGWIERQNPAMHRDAVQYRSSSSLAHAVVCRKCAILGECETA